MGWCAGCLRRGGCCRRWGRLISGCMGLRVDGNHGIHGMHGRCGGENHEIHEGHEKVLMQ